MMHEKDFKEILQVYRQLRLEGVVFPPRDSTQKFMIKFEGTKSLIYETMEGDQIYEEPNKMFKKVNDGPRDFIEASTEVTSMDSHHISQKKKFIGQDYEAQQQQVAEEGGNQFISGDTDTILTGEDIVIIRESCLLLDDIMTNAQHLNELRGTRILKIRRGCYGSSRKP